MYDMKEIKLNRRGKDAGKYITLVDDEDYNFLNQWKWHVKICLKTCYAARTIYLPKNKFITIRMHRVIMKTPDYLEVDHIDHNGLNNQKSNLRNVTPSQNQMNKGGHSKSGFIGVSERSSGNFQANVSIKGDRYCVGTYPSAIEAAIARDTKAKELHGEFAKLNFL